MPEGTEETTETTEESQEETTSWLDSLPDDLKGAECLKPFKDVTGLAKSFVEQQPMLGMEKLAIPKKDDKDGWIKVWNKLGRPEEVGGYELPTENMPDNVPIDEDLTKSFFAEAHEIGLTKQQAASLIRWQTKYSGEQVASFENLAKESQKEAVELLKKEWGDAYDERIRLATGAIKQFSDEKGEFKAFLEETGLGNDPRMIRMMATIGKSIAEDEILGEGHRTSFRMSPHDAKNEISRLQSDDQFMNDLLGIGESTQAGQKEATKKWKELHELAYPGESA